MITYIIRTREGEYYCGKTNNLKRRLREHAIEKKGWFIFKKRNEFDLILTLKGDYEEEIKRFGVKRFMEMIITNKLDKIILELVKRDFQETLKGVSLS